ncbi:uncharacterized protein LOC131626354 isoform X2 [Vicia villosa]|uniref:uncharacterized protein LOC131626354 isoform X2 n=1 Tax=Vicia villosa TaxID=3911 RepID=UPI00273C8F28|nr:uncharacterized protein LOC131626354 isoform X2 [Vicia villosa]
MTSDGADTSKYSTSFGKSFSFKFEDPIGRMNRINCGTEHLDEQAVMLRVVIKDRELPEICRSEGFKVAFGFRQFSQTNTNLWYSH